MTNDPKIAVYVGSSLGFQTQPKPTGPNKPDFVDDSAEQKPSIAEYQLF